MMNDNLSDTANKRQGAEANEQATVGSIYTGKVVTYDPERKVCEVVLDQFDNDVTAYLTSSCVAGLFGFRDHYKPERGARCLVAYGGDKNFILRFYDIDDFDPVAGSARQAGNLPTEDDWDGLEGAKIPGVDGGAGGRGTPHSDMVEGEFDISNLLGVGIQFLTFMTRMAGSDRAMVETHLLNDMVRIISGNFQHLHALGHTEISEEGGLNFTFEGTPYDFEREGAKKMDDEIHPLKGEEDKAEDLSEEDRYKHVLRSRLSMWTGWVGDMVDLMITDPGKVLGELADGRSGRMRMKAGQDGSLLVQSISEIAFERVMRIPIPIRSKKTGDPGSADPDTIRKLSEELSHKWTENNDKLMFPQNVFRLREMSKILGDHMANYRARLHPDYSIQTEQKTDAPSWSSEAEPGPAPSEYVERYATFRLTRDGGWVVLDAYGSSQTMFNGHMTHSAPKHMTFEAGGDMRFIAGQSLNFLARRSMEFSAIVGGIRFKARTWLEFLSTMGSMRFKSDAKSPNDQNPDEAGEEGPDPLILDSAMVFETTRGRTRITSKHSMALEMDGVESDDDASRGIFSIISRYGSMELQALKKLTLTGSDLLLKFTNIVTSARRFLGEVGLFAVGENFVLRSGVVHVKQILTESLYSSGLIKGPESQGYYDPDSQPKQHPRSPHTGHIRTMTDEDPTPDLFGDVSGDNVIIFDDIGAVDAVDAIRALGFPVSMTTTIPFRFSAASEYQWGSDYYQSLTQQMLTLESDKFTSWKEWSMPSNALETSQGNDTSILPFPGTGAQHKTYTGGLSLWAPSPTPKSNTDLAGFNDSPFKFKYWSRDNADDQEPHNT